MLKRPPCAAWALTGDVSSFVHRGLPALFEDSLYQIFEAAHAEPATEG
jgi:hypothetical protein